MQVSDEMVRVALIVENAECNPNENGPTPESMRAALTAALAAMWRPIEEAPKDGSRVLLVRDDNPTMHTAFFRDGRWDCGGYYYFNKPASWMPLPSPPKAEG